MPSLSRKYFASLTVVLANRLRLKTPLSLIYLERNRLQIKGVIKLAIAPAGKKQAPSVAFSHTELHGGELNKACYDSLVMHSFTVPGRFWISSGLFSTVNKALDVKYCCYYWCVCVCAQTVKVLPV